MASQVWIIDAYGYTEESKSTCRGERIANAARAHVKQLDVRFKPNSSQTGLLKNDEQWSDVCLLFIHRGNARYGDEQISEIERITRERNVPLIWHSGDPFGNIVSATRLEKRIGPALAAIEAIRQPQDSDQLLELVLRELLWEGQESRYTQLVNTTMRLFSSFILLSEGFMLLHEYEPYLNRIPIKHLDYIRELQSNASTSISTWGWFRDVFCTEEPDPETPPTCIGTLQADGTVIQNVFSEKWKSNLLELYCIATGLSWTGGGSDVGDEDLSGTFDQVFHGDRELQEQAARWLLGSDALALDEVFQKHTSISGFLWTAAQAQPDLLNFRAFLRPTTFIEDKAAAMYLKRVAPNSPAFENAILGLDPLFHDISLSEEEAQSTFSGLVCFVQDELLSKASRIATDASIDNPQEICSLLFKAVAHHQKIATAFNRVRIQ